MRTESLIVMEGDSSTANPYSSLFKCKKHYASSIQERRLRFLAEQKEKRHQITDKNREQFDQFINVLDDVGTDEMECDSLQNQRKQFKFELMETDWFLDIPDDLEDNWFFKCAPAGFRVLLVFHKKFTVCYDNKGHIVFKKFKSHVSGGECLNTLNGTTILDCIYNKGTRTLFIFDCLCWNNMSMIDSEAEFRFFWLKSKFTEDIQLSHWNNMRFVLMDCIPAQRSLIQNAMFDCLKIDENRYFYDGIVFYHKKSHYSFGKTPLSGWLASYMLTEILHIDVPPEHLFKKPKDYTNVHEYMQNLKTKKKTPRKKKNKSNGMNMDSS